MEAVRQFWHRISIKTKCILMMGSSIAAIWLLAAAVIIQLQVFSRDSDIIMDKYIDTTGFITAFSEENRALEDFIRPTLMADARDTYLEAIAETDREMVKLQPRIGEDLQGEYALKRAICNAMEHYRDSQRLLLVIEDEDQVIQQYLSLKTQVAYIDGYARDLLHNRMIQGGQQWEQIAAANTIGSRWIAVSMIGVTLLTLLIVLLFTRSFIKPLTDLGHAADTIGTGCYDAPPLDIQSMDELGRTAKSFNLMQTEIRRTIQALEKQSEIERHLLEKEVEAVQMQRMLQEGRFAQLQSQINPHFLFNTLSTIAALAREEGAPLSEDLILRLSRFFRYSLESDEKVVTLGREIQLLRDYMELQETRYGERITMEVRADPALSEVLVPKFILQPLVENAILHGLRESGGQVRVRAFQGRQGITILVTDNGCGFDPKQYRESAGRHSVGLSNIRERMELRGGKLDLFSRPGLGTCVRTVVGEEERHAENTGG